MLLRGQLLSHIKAHGAGGELLCKPDEAGFSYGVGGGIIWAGPGIGDGDGKMGALTAAADGPLDLTDDDDGRLIADEGAQGGAVHTGNVGGVNGPCIGQGAGKDQRVARGSLFESKAKSGTTQCSSR